MIIKIHSSTLFIMKWLKLKMRHHYTPTIIAQFKKKLTILIVDESIQSLIHCQLGLKYKYLEKLWKYPIHLIKYYPSQAFRGQYVSNTEECTKNHA